MLTADGKMRLTDVADTEQLLRLIQSVPSPKAEPFKQWLAKVGSERLDQIEDPELSIQQALQDYRRLGYSEDWINQRLKSIEIRKELTDEWLRVGIEDNKDFEQSKTIAKQGGNVAKVAREELEKQIGKSVISSNNATTLRKLTSKPQEDKE